MANFTMAKRQIVGGSAALAAALDHASLLATIDRPILIQGERGTGKELIAERLHYLSPRWDLPLIKVNCAAFSDSLLDSELFGHEAGSFTGASRSHIGRFERAQGGTLLLDELGTMSAQLQEKLLRVIEYGEFERVGGSKTLSCDVRVIGSTHENLPALAEAGSFRWDLLDRLAFDVIQVPALRTRIEDIPALADYFAIRLCHELGRPPFAGFSDEAHQALLQHRWLGNIRELRNVVERSVFRQLAFELPIDSILLDPFVHQNVPPNKAPTDLPAQAIQDESVISGSALPFLAAVDAYKRQLLLMALKKHHFNQKSTARDLNLSYDQLRGMVRKWHLKAD